jgi:alkanesulfonate monooxygenase SsuD/methylene tetrahydromethanopterin reductase-like flavin-dependent oxidoreductase (luciferase family)
MFCDSDEERAREMAYTYLSGYYHSLLDHYQLAGDHFKGTKGYEYYEKMSGVINRYGVNEATKFFADLQVWGTPQQCYEKISWLHTTLGCQTFVAVFDYAGLPFEEVERSMKLFAEEVMPALQAI